MLGTQWGVQQLREDGHFTLPAGWPDFTPHAAVTLAFTLAIVVWIKFIRGKPLWTIGFWLRRLPGDLAFAGVGAIAVGLFYLLAGGAVRAYFGMTADAPDEAFHQFVRNAVFKDLSLGYILGVVVFYPIFEEIWFRGVLYPPMRKDFGRIPAIVITALLFAFAHSNAFPINQFFGGLVFAAAFEMRRTLVAPILLHMAGNGALAVLAWMLPQWGV
jgi:membrane protease YdiL (CAAX protease family)